MRKKGFVIVAALVISILVTGITTPFITAQAACGEVKSVKRVVRADDEKIQKLSLDVLAAIKKKDMKKLSSFVNPDKTLLFAPCASAEKGEYVTFTKAKLASLNKKTKIKWGVAGASGLPIKLSFEQYYKQNLWAADFLGKDVSVNFDKNITNQYTYSSFEKLYPTGHFVEFFFKGTEANANIDWQSMVLVYEEVNGKLYLSAVINEYWTP